jgi:hypothetical protein
LLPTICSKVALSSSALDTCPRIDAVVPFLPMGVLRRSRHPS